MRRAEERGPYPDCWRASKTHKATKEHDQVFAKVLTDESPVYLLVPGQNTNFKRTIF